jgi:hypothetical protein
MRGPHKFPVLPDVLALLAIVALVTVVYLLNLPQNMHALSHRKAIAVELLAGAREAVGKEGALFAALAGATDQDNREQLRKAALENERRFHEAVAAVSGKMPEAKAEMEDLSRQFDELVGFGWKAEEAGRRGAFSDAQSMLESEFVPVLKQLEERIRAIESRMLPETAFAK